MNEWCNEARSLMVRHSGAEMVLKVCVTLQAVNTDEIMSDYLRITQTFLYQTL